jgi:hypothetical protein
MYLPAARLCASTQYVRLILFTSYSCHLKTSFDSVDITGLRIYGTALNVWAHNIIGRFSHTLFISRHAIKFTC